MTSSRSPILFTIGLISDTHNRLHPKLPALMNEVDEIWHLGDVCQPSLLLEIESWGKPLTVVLGNNDPTIDAPLFRTLQRHGQEFYLVHIPPAHAPVQNGWLLHGHTHVPCDEMRDGVRWFNPGSAGLANKGAPLSCAYLRGYSDGVIEPELVLL